MKQYILEACIDSAESAVEAVKGGADRLELCANLIIGGTTPEQALYEKVRELADTRIHVLIRPRYGDFLYTEHEFAIVARSVALYRELGADGVVVGCLLPDGSLDTERMKALREAAGPMSMTLHRAFDMCRDPYEALEQAKDLGIGTILTSGQKNGCMEGRELIAGLVRESGGKVDIMAGGGVDASVIRQMIPATRASSYHMSGKTVLDSGMACRRQEVSMGVPGLGEYEIFRTAREKIQEARRVLDEAAGLAGEWNRGKTGMKFEPKTLDFELSPYTGLTRESWLEAGRYMLEGIFRNIDDFQKPVVMPRKETEITYPHLKDSEEAQTVQRTAEVFEGLTRSFFIAAPMIGNVPDLTVCGYPIAEYYKNQVLRVCTRGDALYVGTYEDQQEITGHTDPYRTFQQTVETCALVICLWVSKKQIWDTYTKAEKDVIAGFLDSYAHASTVPQNWRLFNMLDMAFLHMEGYPVEKDVMRDHAQAILAYYAGDGWYRDGHSFDYYSCWAFNVYGPIWNLWYGYENEPYIAKRFEENSNRLMETYGDFFDRDGWTNMWGRSNIYRNAATSAFDGNLMMPGGMPEGRADPGRARRISSGSLMQFLSREDFLYQGVPALGFYGQFSPLVQGVFLRGVAFWLGKAFLCLHLPADHPFWTAKENNGTWEELGEGEVKVTCLDGPALCFSNHQANGETILRTGKVVKQPGDEHGMWNYSKLCYNTKYPWEAAPQAYAPELVRSPEESVCACSDEGLGENAARSESADKGGGFCVEAQQYVLRDGPLPEGYHAAGNGKSGKAGSGLRAPEKANVTFWHGQRDGVLYRRQFFGYNLETECHWIQAMNLADFAVPYGILRADRLRLYKAPVTVTLGSYGFPDNGTEVIEKTCGNAKAIILKGTDATGCEKQMAMTVYDGWRGLSLVRSRGTNPDSEKSVILYASMERKKHYGGFEPYVLISQVITKESHEDFGGEELFPVAEVICADPEGCGSFGPVVIRMKDGSEKVVDFDGMEGRLML